MEQVNESFIWADVVVLASPMFWGIITGQLKTVIDRFYSLQNKLGMENFKKDSILIMTSRGENYDMAMNFYSIFSLIGWNNIGTILGADKEDEAKALGENIS